MTDSRGFTLVEVMVSAAMIAIALIPAAAVMVTAYGTLARAGEQTTALALSQQRMELLKNQPFTSSNLAAGTTIETLTGTYAGYTRTTSIVDNSPRAGVKTATVSTVSPSGRTVALTTRMAS